MKSEPRQVFPPDVAAEFGQQMFDIVQSLGDVRAVTPEQEANYALVDGYVQVWKEQKTQIEALELKLAAADDVMRLCENYRGDEELDVAISHYKALRAE